MNLQNIFVGEGNLGETPTLKMVPMKPTGEQRAVLEFSVKFNVQKLNQANGEYEDDGGFWGRVSVWGRRAEIYNGLLKKGCRVLIVGEQRQRPYLAQKGERAGQELTSNEIVANYVGIVPLGIDEIVWSPKADHQTATDNQSFIDDEIPM